MVVKSECSHMFECHPVALARSKIARFFASRRMIVLILAKGLVDFVVTRALADIVELAVFGVELHGPALGDSDGGGLGAV